jgi:2-(1,2-epoxy-1,2-dihydrophenyl)acetyl-CoA isomerase
MADVLSVEMQGGLQILTLNRPEAGNALNADLTKALNETLAVSARDPEVRAVLITGAGGRFCVGGDVKGMNAGAGREVPQAVREAELRHRMNASRYLHEMPKPTIAAIEGAAAGAGLSLALACDFRVAGEGAKITTAFAKVGLSGDYGGTYFLTQMLGAAKARELYLLSPMLSGKEAAALGLATRAVPDGTAVQAAMDLIGPLAEGPTVTLGKIKENIALAEGGGTLAECFDMEARNHAACSQTADHKEAAAAFVEKRKPAFRGA